MHGGRILIGVGAVTAAVVILVALAWLFQRRLIYLPSPGRVPPAPAVLHAGEDVAFDTADGLRLAGWFVPAATGRSRATVMVLGGNAGNRVARAPLAAELSRAGLSVLLVDYRGYGGTPGSPSERGLLADARAARAYLAARGDVDPALDTLVQRSIRSRLASTDPYRTPGHPRRRRTLRAVLIAATMTTTSGWRGVFPAISLWGP